MTIQTRLGPEQAAQEVLVEAEAHYTRTIQTLHAIIEDVKAGQLDRTKELKDALRNLHNASQTAFDERSKVEKRLRAEAGILNDYAFDLDGARSEIRGRLDRLRNAAGAGGVPEGS
ncbi:hypothetical protein [Actibacterium pelagium]|uniref:Uncharacterized protein n=1 Tax=Actibacterium pelagium TaxID=2029103 RepID=A0A917ABJ4_9RHOB|nr:hypothetical protein [Actibacterium pelagium]GGE40510.1 hypothetical protein GCM10011517_05220 [Actibacterium pelagium]